MSTNILSRLLAKKGVSYEELNDEERATFNKWREAISGRSITDDDVQHFMTTEYDDAVKKLSSATFNERTDTFLKMKVDFIIKIKEFLALPAIEKQMIEQQIGTQL